MWLFTPDYTELFREVWPNEKAENMEEVTRGLDLGSGTKLNNVFSVDEMFGVDIRATDSPNIMRADLVLDGIPYPDNYFDVVTAFDFLEHVPRVIYLDGARQQPFIELMYEVHRVLKPNGIFYARTPAYPNQEAFQDPTHVNIISWNTLYYFLGNYDEYMPDPGFKNFFDEVEPQSWDGPWLVWTLRAIK